MHIYLQIVRHLTFLHTRALSVDHWWDRVRSRPYLTVVKFNWNGKSKIMTYFDMLTFQTSLNLDEHSINDFS